MQNQQNQESFYCFGVTYAEMHDADDSEELQSPQFRQALQESVHCFQAAEKNSAISKQIDFLAAESFHTEPRGSLQIVPDARQHDFGGKPDEDLASTLKSSQNCLLFEDQDDDEDHERKLIIKTEALTIHSSASDMAEKLNELSPRKCRSPTKSHKQKAQPIRQAKQLIRELKREYKYNHKILADVSLSVEERTVNIKGASIQPIVSEKGQLSGLIVKHRQAEHKIKVVNQAVGQFEPVLELWDEHSEAWNELAFKVKLISD